MNIELAFVPLSLTILGLILISRPRWNEKRLISFLDEHNVPHNSWGLYKTSNSRNDLLESLQCGEVWLESQGKDQPPILNINVAVVTIWCDRNDHTFILKEYHRDSENGEFKQRPFSGSLGEKIKTEFETARMAALRGLAEELGESAPAFKSSVEIDLQQADTEIAPSQQSNFYSGLIDVYHRWHFCLNIETDSRFYSPEYRCVDNGHEVLFCWLPILSPY